MGVTPRLSVRIGAVRMPGPALGQPAPAELAAAVGRELGHLLALAPLPPSTVRPADAAGPARPGPTGRPAHTVVHWPQRTVTVPASSGGAELARRIAAAIHRQLLLETGGSP